jgi:hypothetical protein
MDKPKVLLAAPTSIFKDYVFLEWYLHASTLTYPNYDIVICDNSLDTSYAPKLRRMGVKTLYVSPRGKTPRQYIAESQNMLREVFLEGRYDYFFSLEVDIFPPRNIIEKLLSCGKPIVSAPYFYDFGIKSKPLVHYFVQKPDGGITTHCANLSEAIDWLDGTVKPIYQSGVGCTLIERSILEKIPFRWESGNNGFSDSFLYYDLTYKLKINNWLDTSILCRHYNSDWFLNPDHVNSKDIVV